jgi:Amt family ammonium transporter
LCLYERGTLLVLDPLVWEESEMGGKTRLICLLLIAFGLLASLPAAFAQDAAAAPAVNGADTAWMLISTALVLFMTPGLALFYGGLVRSKNVLSTMMHSFAAMMLVTLVWALWGYSLAFGGDLFGGFVGGFEYLGLKGVSWDTPREGLGVTIPHLLFAMYQGMFAIITPALISGAFAERMKFSSYALFLVLWSTLVYSPIAHWVWHPDGWLAKMGVQDFAGGTVVHISSGIAALAAALVMGKRKGYPHTPILPHNMPWCALGAGILWFGWFGFNGGSSLASNGVAVVAFTNTHLAAAAAAMGWFCAEWIWRGKGTMLGLATGAVAGLVGITPAAGFVTPGSAILIGALTSLVCYWFVSRKERFGYDDSLDAFGVHGVGGTTGAILTGVFAFQPLGLPLFLNGDISQATLIMRQILGAGVTLAYSFVISLILFKVVDAILGLRVRPETEDSGLDVDLHGESGYTL